jgi:two-component system phosphate regulon sensor histidine kinase PhoR
MERLAALIQEQQGEIMDAWRKRVLTTLPSSSPETRGAVEDHIPYLLDELSNALIAQSMEATVGVQINAWASSHGIQRSVEQFDVADLINEYNILREEVGSFALRHNMVLTPEIVRVISSVMNAATVAAVRSFSRLQQAETDTRIRRRMAHLIHELKTPLTAVMTAAKLLEQRLPPESFESSHTMLRIIDRNSDRLHDLVSRLVSETLETPGESLSLNMNTVALHPLVQRVIEDIQSISEASNVSVVNEIPQNSTIFGDEFLLEQVIQNLVSNALNYTEQGRVRIGSDDGNHSRGETTFWVEDTGVGIPIEGLNRLFQRGEGDPGRPGSSGLGLVNVDRIVKAHGGKIKVESEVGRGSKFSVFLPAR